MVAVISCLLLLGAAASATAQAPVVKLTLEEAVSLARAVNPSVRAKEFEVEAVGANEITAALRPNPVATFLAEQFGSGSAALTQYTFNVGQPIELGGKRQRRIDSAKAATKVTGYELIDLLDYLDAQRTYREKSLEYLRSLANYRTAVYVLEAAVGGQLEN
jgi:outer membrane protein TolC